MVLRDLKRSSVMIEIKVNDNRFETDSTFRAYAYLTALVNYRFNHEDSKAISDLQYFNLFIDIDNVDGFRLVECVCDNWSEIPKQNYNELKEFIISRIDNYI